VASPLINPLTKKRLDAFLARPSHALLLKGDEGSGLRELSESIRESLTSGLPDAEALVRIEPNEKGTITIESIRGLARRLKMHHSSDAVAVITVIESAEMMPTEAQNSLLKLLEEPPQGVLFLLLAHDTSKILTTISSRCVAIDVLPVSLEQAQAYFGDTSEDFTRTYRLSGGLPGLLSELKDSDDHPLAKAINEAKVLLSATPFDRLKKIDSDFKKRDDATLIIRAILRVCTGGLQSGRASSRWIHNCQASVHALKQLEANVQTKIVMDQLFLNVR
jgi:hypothetical protein